MGDDRRKRWRHDAPPPPITAGSSTSSSNRMIMNPYHVLQVRNDATPAEIRGAYRRLALWHHPGRRKAQDLPAGELQRRYNVFSTLAASYEILIDMGSRQLYDALLRQECDGEIWVGGKPWLPSTSSLSHALTTGSGGEKVEDGVPAMEKSETTVSEGNEESSDTLALFVKARGGRSLSDPYDVFEAVFGSLPFERVIPCEAPNAVVTATLRPASDWTVSTRILQNGSVLSTTSRVLHDRKLTRTEIITDYPDGQKRTFINVEGEDIVAPEAETQVSTGCFDGHWLEAVDDFYKCFNVCGGTIPEIKGN